MMNPWLLSGLLGLGASLVRFLLALWRQDPLAIAELLLVIAQISLLLRRKTVTEKNDRRLAVGEVARTLGCQGWQIRRLFERGLLPPAERIGLYRVIPESELPKVKEALQKAGYLRM